MIFGPLLFQHPWIGTKVFESHRHTLVTSNNKQELAATSGKAGIEFVISGTSLRGSQTTSTESLVTRLIACWLNGRVGRSGSYTCQNKLLDCQLVRGRGEVIRTVMHLVSPSGGPCLCFLEQIHKSAVISTPFTGRVRRSHS